MVGATFLYAVLGNEVDCIIVPLSDTLRTVAFARIILCR